MLERIKRLIKKLNSYESRFNNIELALGRIEGRQLEKKVSSHINDYEFKISSQWGEDGIIQYLISNIEIKNKIFVEFGVETYQESNTRFLLQNNNWSGLVIDGSENNIEYIKKDPIYWKYNLKAECAFIDKDNINNLISKNGISGDIGILSVDIDGNDYWVWESIDCISPRIVICEYNSNFGYTYGISVPYCKTFYRTEKHYSNTYYGASIDALESLAKSKGYSLVGSNTAGNNVFFIRNDLVGDLKIHTAKEAYVKSQFRESRDKNGQLTYASIEENLKIISDEEVVVVNNMKKVKIGRLLL